MEKLCQAFENGKELVELSQSSPHDISNVLKLYLRQVGLKSDVALIIHTLQACTFVMNTLFISARDQCQSTNRVLFG